MTARTVSLLLPTRDGEFLAHYSKTGLAELNFPSRPKPGVTPEKSAPSAEIAHWHQLTADAVNAILSGKSPAEFPPFDLSVGSDFQRAVWQAMLQIPFARTRTYTEIAKAIGHPEALRSVGAACGANPIPVLIPCHRVVAAKGKLGGFSGGLDWKRKLLGREGSQLELGNCS